MSIFVFDDNDNMHKVEMSDILCIRKIEENRKIMTCTRQGCLYAPSTMKQLSEVFAQFDFFQIDKNKLINLRQIDEINNDNVILGDHVFEVAKRRLKDMNKILSQLGN